MISRFGGEAALAVLRQDRLANPPRFLDLILFLEQMNLRKQGDRSGERLWLARRQALISCQCFILLTERFQVPSHGQTRSARQLVLGMFIQEGLESGVCLAEFFLGLLSIGQQKVSRRAGAGAGVFADYLLKFGRVLGAGE